MEDNQPLNEKDFAKGLGQLLNSLVDVANDEREKSQSYKDMFDTGKEGHEGLLRNLQSKMTDNVLDACHVLEKKHGRLGNEVFYFLMALPYLENKLVNHIQKTEGSSCSVDKAYYILSESLQKLLDKRDPTLLKK